MKWRKLLPKAGYASITLPIWVIEELQKRAKNHCRTPSLQIQWMLERTSVKPWRPKKS